VTAAEAVTLTGSSTGSPNTYYWIFGDGGTSTSQNPSHTYSSTGNYTVNFSATNTSSGSVAWNNLTQISVTLITPAVSFTATPTSGSAPLSVQFTDTSGYAPSSWSWNFGDGDSTNNTQQNPLHIYLISGIYNVSLTATNSAGSNTSIQLNYIVVSAVPVANFTGYPTFGYAPFVVNFTDTSYGLPTSWSWDFGDWIYTSSVQNPTHIYNNPGKYSVSLTVSNAYGTNTTKIRRYIIVTTSPSFKNDYTWVFTLMTLIETLPIFIGIGLLLYYLKMPKREPVVLLGGITSFLTGIVILIVMVITIPYLGSTIGGLI
jgi:PKD repeat protein